jgi:alpha-glucosidase (family GH31 glycosyl hydrolase)
MRDAEFPLDVQWTDIDTMASWLDFTYDTTKFHGLSEFVRALQADGMHYVNIIDPGISSTQTPGTYPPFDDGIRRKIFITKFNSVEPIIGEVGNMLAARHSKCVRDTLSTKVWPGKTAFPDFTHPEAIQWWTNIAAAYHATVPFDGMWIVRIRHDDNTEAALVIAVLSRI